MFNIEDPDKKKPKKKYGYSAEQMLAETDDEDVESEYSNKLLAYSLADGNFEQYSSMYEARSLLEIIDFQAVRLATIKSNETVG